MNWKQSWILLVAAALCAAVYVRISTSASASESAVVIPAPALDNPKAAGPVQTAVLAGGCFWGVQAVYQHVQGVRNAVSGYSGGSKATADYETVSDGKSGHAESVQVTFDPKEISYGEILQIYFSVIHDPTQLNKQGPDEGTQYRSNIFYSDDSQKRIAEAYVAQLAKAKVFGGKIVTRVDALKGFYPAEGYHQDFLINNPSNPYIAKFDIPKVQNLLKVFPSRYRVQPVTVKASK
ncbi:MAG TPA: peptide-methionine (S)-S-oxide reductase MsrA [Terriglobia bacterium]|nr:peptide-methionine (S)-S-oxide reductase MsrA [Terriglobia bacterium]